MGGEWTGELKTTLRGLLRRPGYAFLAVVSLALGVGSVTAGYGLLHRVVLRPLPYEEPERLVVVRTPWDGDAVGVTLPEYLDVASHAGVFESVAALVEPHLDRDRIWTGRDERAVLPAVRVTEGFFRTLGVAPRLGSLPEGSTVDGRRIAVSSGFWRRELGGDPAAIGRSLEIDEEPYVVAAVLPASFEFPLGPDPTDVWILHTPEPVEPRPEMPLSWRIVGRLSPGVGPGEAEARVAARVDAVRSGLTAEPRGVELRPLADDLFGSFRRPLLLLAGSSALVLLVAALNLSLLIAARNVERGRELGIRVALGADRSRLLRPLLMEAVVLALVGGGIAVAGAGAVLARVAEARPGGLTRMTGGGLGVEVILVGLAAAVGPALLAAALPARRLETGLQARGPRGASPGPGRRRMAWTFSIVESALVLALLTTAALFLQSLRAVTAVDPGFDTTSTVALEVFLPPDEYAAGDGEALSVLLDGLGARIGALPGVDAVGTITNLPLSSRSWSGTLRIEGREELTGDEGPVVDWELAGPGYFDAAGIPLVRGRAFDGGDRLDAPAVAVVNETMARLWWPDGDPVGARISGGGPFRTVVGVVGDVKQQGLAAATRGFMYLPVLQMPYATRQEVVVRVRGDEPGSVVGALRSALLEVEPNAAPGRVRTLEQVAHGSAGAFRLRAVLLGAFASMALVLGMAGIYGVAAHGVRARRRDIGIRMALGARGGRIVRGVLADALIPVTVGLAGGALVVTAAAPLLDGLLFGVSPGDPVHLLGIAALLVASGAAAVLPSAVRARSIDPVSMLRDE